LSVKASSGTPAARTPVPASHTSSGCTTSFASATGTKSRAGIGPCSSAAATNCERASTAPIVNNATGEAASASRPMVFITGATGCHCAADDRPPSRIAQGMGLSATPWSAFFAAFAAPCWSAPSRRDSAMHSELVITRSIRMVRIAGPAACAPSSATSSGTPMKPVLGKAATSAPKDASFQRMRSFMLDFTVPATISNAHANQVRSATGSSSCAMGVLAPKRYSRHGSAKKSTNVLRPAMASNGSMRRRAAR
jgi:hypothetical protein